jgi:hypothetical protein
MGATLDAAYEERVYAGLLGKLIGVYLGRPVEGWPYDDIRSRFGLVDRFVNGDLGLPLIVADDDISGTLTFGRVVEDSDGVTPADVGNTWLNYIVEDRTILWWGGYGRSTGHTAYLNLKRGIRAPESGSIARNGSTLAEQIGAQIFSDAFVNTAMALAALVVGGNDFRYAVADRALVVSADGGECVTDAVLETRRIVRSARKLSNAPVPDRRPRFDFDFPGTLQGFAPCPYVGGGTTVRQHHFEDGSTALLISGSSVSTPVFLDPGQAVTNFSTPASPTLYPGTTVRAVVSSPDGASERLYAIYDGASTSAGPSTYSQSGIPLSSIWDTQPRGLAPWVSSAKNFEADFATTFSVSHPDPLGVVTTGTRDWVDYEVSSRLTFSLSRAAGPDPPSGCTSTASRTSRRRLAGGGAGFFVDTGTMSADGFTVRSHHRAQTRDQKGTTRYDAHRKVEQHLGQHQAG